MSSRSNPYLVLAILTVLNFLNFIDRSILYQVQPLIQRDMHVSTTQIGLLTTAFTICLLVAAPLVGVLADRCPRRPIVAGGAIAWSVATLFTGFASSFTMLLVRHAVVGIGEAVMVAAPGYVADLFPEDRRARMLSFLWMAVPVGTACGFLLGGVLGQTHGWRAPFYVAAAPGVIAALVLLYTREPVRGAQDAAGVGPGVRTGAAALLGNRVYVACTAAVALLMFTLNGVQVFMPDFLMNVRGMTMLGAGAFLAFIAVVNGIAGIHAGGWLADRLRRRRPDADYLVPACVTALAVPVTVAAIYMPRPGMFTAIFLAHFLMLAAYSPLGTAVVQSVPARVRSTAIAVHMVAVRLLGDAASPPVIGFIRDRTGSMQTGFLVTVPAIALAAAILVHLGRGVRTRGTGSGGEVHAPHEFTESGVTV